MDNQSPGNPYSFVSKLVILCLLTVHGVLIALGAAGMACLGLALMLAPAIPKVRHEIASIGSEIWRLMDLDPKEGHRLVTLYQVAAGVITALWCAKSLLPV